MITIDPAHLTPDQVRQAEYLAALAAHNAAPNDPDLTAEVYRLEPDWRETAIITGEAVRRFGIPPATLSWFARENMLRAEKRGKFWYYCLSDLEAVAKLR